MFQSAKRQYEAQGNRAGRPDQTRYMGSMPVLIGAAMIATAILLSTLITALSSRYVGMESPTEESAWLIDRLDRRCLSLRGSGTWQGVVRRRDRDRQRRGSLQTLTGWCRPCIEETGRSLTCGACCVARVQRSTQNFLLRETQTVPKAYSESQQYAGFILW